MPCHDEYRRCPTSYLLTGVDEGLIDALALARALMYHLNHDQLREVADEILPIEVECAACHDHFQEMDIEYTSEDGQRHYCSSCVNQEDHLDDEDFDGDLDNGDFDEDNDSDDGVIIEDYSGDEA